MRPAAEWRRSRRRHLDRLSELNRPGLERGDPAAVEREAKIRRCRRLVEIAVYRPGSS